MSLRPLPRVLVRAAGLIMVVAVSIGAPVQAFSAKPTIETPASSETSVFTFPPPTYPLAGSGTVDTKSVELWDLTSGFELPLTGAGVGEIDGVTVAYLPELEQGAYEIRWVGEKGPRTETFSVEVQSFSTNGELVVRSQTSLPEVEFGPLWFVAVVGATFGLFAVVLLRRRVVLAALAFVVLSGAGVAGAMVAGTGGDATMSLAACRALPDGSEQRFTCLRDYVYTSAATPTAMMDVLDGLRTDGSIVGDSEQHTCHNVGHLLGRLLVEKKYPIVEVVRAERGLCDYGLLHGALENGGRMMSDAEWGDALATVCSTFTGDAGLQCAHGAGHGTSIRTNGAVDPSLAMCAKMGGPEAERLLWQCATGVFMGYANRTMIALRFPTVEAMEASLPAPQQMYMPSMCASLSGVVREACWLAGFQFLGSTSVGMLQDDDRFTSLDVNVDFCSTMPDAGDCIQGVMVRARAKAVGRSDAEVIGACARHDGDLWDNCILGFVQSEVARLNESTATNRYEQVERLCETVESAKPGSKMVCLDRVRFLGGNLLERSS